MTQEGPGNPEEVIKLVIRILGRPWRGHKVVTSVLGGTPPRSQVVTRAFGAPRPRSQTGHKGFWAAQAEVTDLVARILGNNLPTELARQRREDKKRGSGGPGGQKPCK